MNVYEMARRKIAQRAPIAVFQTAPKRTRHDRSDTREYRQNINRDWYRKNTKKARARAHEIQYAFKERWGFFPSCWYYWTKKLKSKEITPGQLPKKFIPIYKEYRKAGRI